MENTRNEKLTPKKHFDYEVKGVGCERVEPLQDFVIGILRSHVVFLAAYSIKCWHCRSDADPKCADPFDNSTLAIMDCKQAPVPVHLPGAQATMCRKIRQKGNKFLSLNTSSINITCLLSYIPNSSRRMALFPQLCLPRRARDRRGRALLPDANGDLQHLHGVLHVQQQGRVQFSWPDGAGAVSGGRSRHRGHGGRKVCLLPLT